MEEQSAPGQIVILNGAPRAGKSSIVKVIQDTFSGVWMNLGVDVFARGVTPLRYQPGIGLRPGPGPGFGGDNPELERLVPTLYAAVYESIMAHSRLGLNVVTEGGHHGAIHPGLLGDCARRLTGLPVLFVGVRRRDPAAAGGRAARHSVPTARQTSVGHAKLPGSCQPTVGSVRLLVCAV